MRVNVPCGPRGWLFQDVQEAFCDQSGDGIEITASDEPDPSADRWIYLRSDEAQMCPDRSRALLTFHDFWPRKWLDDCLEDFGALSFVHPKQALQYGYQLDMLPENALVQPIGARRAFTLRESMPERFTVGWVGREMRTPDGRDQKRPHLLRHAIDSLRAENVMINSLWLGPGLGDSRLELGPRGADEYERPDRGSRRTPSFDQLQRFYHSIDVLVVTSLPEPGPLSVFEALRCGVPVIFPHDREETSMDVGEAHSWCYRNTRYEGAQSIAASIVAASDNRHYAFRTRSSSRAVPLQEDWIEANVRLAVEVAGA